MSDTAGAFSRPYRSDALSMPLDQSTPPVRASRRSLPAAQGGRIHAKEPGERRLPELRSRR